MNKKNSPITYKHLERFLTCQEYFIWNSDIQKELENLDNEGVEEEISFWSIMSDYDIDDIEDYKYVEVIKSGFGFVEKLFINQIKEWADRENKRILIISEKSNDRAFEKTKQALNDSNIDWIINPVFIYGNMISKLALFRKDSHEVFSLIHGSKSKLKNYIKAYFDFNVLSRLDIKINDYLFFTYDNKKDYLKPKDLSFVSSKYCWTQKNGPTNKIIKTIEEHSQDTIIEKLKSGVIRKKNKSFGKAKNKLEIEEIEVSLNLKDFDFYIEKIEKARELKHHTSINLKDDTVWGTNPNFLDIFDFDKFNLKRYSGLVLNKKELLDIEYGHKTVNEFLNSKRIFSYIVNNRKIYEKDIIKKYVDKIKDSNIVWYDFEGFSLPYIVLPHTKPYQQLVFQASIIRTEKEKITFSKNIVVDPLEISIKSFIDIINAIYSEEADYYVVFNQGYELKKLEDMVDLISREKPELWKEYFSKVEIIKDKTIDLLDLFRVTSNSRNIPPIFISDLLGFYSIKKLEKYITENNFKLEVMIEPYKNLEVQNGLMAMNKAIQRYLLTIGDKEWSETRKNLEKYCENDVKAMIMVYFFIKQILEEKE